MTDLTRIPTMFGGVNTASAIGEASPDAVWRTLFDRARWLPDFVGKEAIDGPADAVGERARFTTRREDGGLSTRNEEILLADPPRRLVTRLALVPQDATFAFAEWRLEPLGSGTRVEMSLYWLDLPGEGADWPATVALRADYLAHTQTILDGIVTRIASAAAS